MREQSGQKQWLGNEDVCGLLQISPRTLQSYRDNGILPFSQIGRKCYYRVSDVEQLINNSKRNPDERKRIYGQNVRFKCISRQLGEHQPESDNYHYRNGDSYLLSVIHINETSRQASPATYEIQEDEDGFFIYYNLKRSGISYDRQLDLLTLSALGDYMRN